MYSYGECMLSQEFNSFYLNWNSKAELCNNNTIDGSFDRFITLYIVYNRLYGEMTFHLVRVGQIKEFVNFPDRKAAIEYVIAFLKAEKIIQVLNQNHKHYDQICNLIQEERFHIILKQSTGEAQLCEDKKLLKALQSETKNEKARAILQTIYSVRCNMLHGQKNFIEVQRELIDPLSEILMNISKELYEKLKSVN